MAGDGHADANVFQPSVLVSDASSLLVGGDADP